MTQSVPINFYWRKQLSFIMAAILVILSGFVTPVMAGWADAVKNEIIVLNPLETPVLSCTTDGLDARVSWTQIPEAAGYTIFFTPSSTAQENVTAFQVETGETARTFRLSEGDDYRVSVQAHTASGRASGVSNIESVSIPVYGESDINGKVYLYSPVSGATVCVATGNTVEDAGFCANSDADGMWQGLHVDPIAPPVRIEVKGGQEGEWPFEGTLSAYLPYRDVVISDPLKLAPGSDVAVNILTTIIDRYMLASGVDYETAVERVIEFFRLPEDIDVFSRETWEQDFSPAEFTVRCMTEKDGDFDLYVDSLVDRIGNGENETMTSDNKIDFGTAFGKQVVKVGFGSWAGEMAIGIVGGTLVKAGINIILPKLGFKTTEGLLSDIQGQISNLQNDVQQISGQIVELKKDIGKSIDKQTLEDIENELDKLTERINDDYDTFHGYITEGAATTKKIDVLNDRILANGGVKDAVRDIHINLTSNSNSILTTLYKNLVDDIDSLDYEDRGRQLMFAYNTLQLRFNELILAQLKGSLMVVNAINYIGDQEEGTIDPESEDYQDKLQAYLDKEVEAFLSTVERLVAASADVRTMMYGEYSMFPDEVKEIFFHADFLAQQLSTKHDAGFNIRVLSDAAIADSFYTAPTEGAFNGTPQKTSWHTCPAPIPDHYQVDYYLGWSQLPGENGTEWRFSRQNEVTTYKVVYPTAYAGTTPSRIPKTHTVGYYDFETSGELGYFDDDGNRTTANAAGSTLYGHAVVIARRSPKFTDSHIQSKNEHGEWSTYFSQRGAAAAGQLKMKYVLEDKYREMDSLFDRPPLPYANSEMQISTWIKNDTDEDQSIDISFEEENIVEINGFENVNSPRLYLSYNWAFEHDGIYLFKGSNQNYEDRGVAGIIGKWVDITETLPVQNKNCSLKAGNSAKIKFLTDYNIVDITGYYTYGKDDTGSEAIFSHRIKTLEMIPRP